jgi:hypothetical protein
MNNPEVPEMILAMIVIAVGVFILRARERLGCRSVYFERSQSIIHFASPVVLPLVIGVFFPSLWPKFRWGIGIWFLVVFGAYFITLQDNAAYWRRQSDELDEIKRRQHNEAEAKHQQWLRENYDNPSGGWWVPKKKT